MTRPDWRFALPVTLPTLPSFVSKFDAVSAFRRLLCRGRLAGLGSFFSVCDLELVDTVGSARLRLIIAAVGGLHARGRRGRRFNRRGFLFGLLLGLQPSHQCSCDDLLSCRRPLRAPPEDKA